ncbi:hypothetical protein K440DRAFT_205140 [Wilcoxina mikolae CBS 423.85]|nr:hypothetical protein K440DRAFT_205140 [Wilcoxina mikolae CBS 423.85]
MKKRTSNKLRNGSVSHGSEKKKKTSPTKTKKFSLHLNIHRQRTDRQMGNINRHSAPFISMIPSTLTLATLLYLYLDVRLRLIRQTQQLLGTIHTTSETKKSNNPLASLCCAIKLRTPPVPAFKFLSIPDSD